MSSSTIYAVPVQVARARWRKYAAWRGASQEEDEQMITDIRDAVRQWRSSPLVIAVAIVSLALGIGANTAIFAVLNALLLKPLPGDEPHRVVSLRQESQSIVIPRGEQRTIQPARITNPAWLMLRDTQPALGGVAAYLTDAIDTSAPGQPTANAWGLFVSGSYFDVVRVGAAVGRLVEPQDDHPAADAVAVLSHAFWERAFARDPRVVGTAISVERQPVTIVGVTAPSFYGLEIGRSFDVAMPLDLHRRLYANSPMTPRAHTYALNVIGRLMPGQDIRQAQAALRAGQQAIAEATLPSPQFKGRHLAEPWILEPTQETQTAARTTYRTAVIVLAAIVAIVLLVACANLANLLLAQGASRRRDLAVRLSLGASRTRLLRQFVVESLLLSTIGAIAGGVVGVAASRVLVTLLSTARTPVFLDVSPDVRVFAFTATVALLTALVCGVLPAWKSTRVDPLEALQTASRGMIGSTRRLSIAQGLLAIQLGLAFLLMFTAAVLIQSFVRITTEDYGFDRGRVQMVAIGLDRLARPGRLPGSIVDAIREQLAAVPNVEAAAYVLSPPFFFGGYVSQLNGTDTRILYGLVSPDYFRVIGSSIIAGAGFANVPVPGTAIVNSAFVREHLGGKPAVGEVITLLGQKQPLHIVGVVSDTKFRTLRGAAPPFVYLPWHDEARPVGSLLQFAMRTASERALSQRTVVDAVERVTPGATVTIRSLDDDAAATIVRERAITLLAAIFGGLTLVLAAVGLYGVMAYHVVRRRAELGVRMALGATPERVRLMVLSQVGFVTIAGMTLGGVIAAAGMRFVKTLLYGVSLSDPGLIAAAVVTLCAVSSAAGYLPARRASQVDPMETLREP
jgi:putative ABC transport system permease protein